MMPLAPRRLFQASAVLMVVSAAVLFAAHGMSPAADFDPMDDFCLVAPVTPYTPSSGVAMFEPRAVPADARCPVCGMYPARFPHWAAQTIFRDGATQYFDSPVNLHVFLANVSRYSGGYAKADVAVSFVTDVDGGDWIEAQHAYYVHGSSAQGPMRDGNLPAFGTREAAERFAEQRGGAVLTADEITADVLRELTHGAHHHHHR